MDNLIDALIESIKIANQPCEDSSHTAVLLAIYDDSTFEIVKRCWPNSTYCSGPHSFYKSQKDVYYLTVPNTAYPAQQWPFDLLEFCARYSIKITTREVIDMSGQKRLAAWERKTA